MISLSIYFNNYSSWNYKFCIVISVLKIKSTTKQNIFISHMSSLKVNWPITNIDLRVKWREFLISIILRLLLSFIFCLHALWPDILYKLQNFPPINNVARYPIGRFSTWALNSNRVWKLKKRNKPGAKFMFDSSYFDNSKLSYCDC